MAGDYSEDSQQCRLVLKEGNKNGKNSIAYKGRLLLCKEVHSRVCQGNNLCYEQEFDERNLALTSAAFV